MIFTEGFPTERRCSAYILQRKCKSTCSSLMCVTCKLQSTYSAKCTNYSIETGRYIGLPVEERICRSCNTGQVEDEQHFCVECPALEEARAPLLHLLNLHHMGSGAVSDKDKFITIMQNPDRRTAKLLYNMFLKCTS